MATRTPLEEVRAISAMDDPEAREYVLDYIAAHITDEDLVKLLWKTLGRRTPEERIDARMGRVLDLAEISTHDPFILQDGDPPLHACPDCLTSDYNVSAHDRFTGYLITKGTVLPLEEAHVAAAKSDGPIYVIACFMCAYTAVVPPDELKHLTY